MIAVTPEQLMCFGRNCSRCDKKAVWLADPEWPVYCDDHFPYYLQLDENGNEKVEIQD